MYGHMYFSGTHILPLNKSSVVSFSSNVGSNSVSLVEHR